MSATNNRTYDFTLVSIARNYYGHLGIQLHEFSRQNYPSIIRLFANLAIGSVTIYGIIVLDCFSLNDWHRLIAKQKKLFFAMLINIVFNYGVSFFCIFRFAYYLYGGRQVARALDCSYLRVVADRHLSPRTNAIVSIIAFCVGHLHTFGAIYFKYYQFSARESSIVKIVECFAIYAHLSLKFFEFHLLHYFQWLCLRALTDIEADLQRYHSKSFDCAIEQIKILSRINCTLHSAISFPLMIMLLVKIADIIIAVCFIIVHIKWSDQIMILYIALLIVRVFYFCYILNLNHRCRSTVLRICDLLRNIAMEKEDSRIIRSHEIGQYCDAFQLRIWHLASLDMSALFSVALFILSYVIFIVQTN